MRGPRATVCPLTRTSPDSVGGQDVWREVSVLLGLARSRPFGAGWSSQVIHPQPRTQRTLSVNYGSGFGSPFRPYHDPSRGRLMRLKSRLETDPITRGPAASLLHSPLEVEVAHGFNRTTPGGGEKA